MKLTPKQSNIFVAEERYRVAVCGRRWGKTYLAIAEMLKAAMLKDFQVVWYVAPTYRMAKQIVWDEIKRITPPQAVAKVNESEMSIRFANGSEIALRGADNPDSLRGVGLDFLVLDELDDMKPETWYEVLRPATADKLARVLFIGTPKGYRTLKELSETDSPHWRSWHYTTLDGGNVSPDEIQQARQEMSGRQFRQEFEASFESLAGRVYSNFNRQDSVSPTKDHQGELMIGVDFNVDPMTAVVGVRVADQLHIVNEIILRNSNTEEMAQEICRLYPHRHITTYPDPSGRARKTSATAGKTDFTILKQHGFKVIAPKKHPLVVDRVNTVNALLRTSDGRRRLYVDPGCKKLIKGLDGLTYTQKGQPDKESGLDHLPDALGYLVCAEYPLRHTVISQPQRWT